MTRFVPVFDDTIADDPRPVLVRVSPGLCHGWGACHHFASEVYQLDEDGKVEHHLLEVPAEHAALARLGALACPEGAIQYLGPIGDLP
jgi:ferredoxin